jgi:hypothetical protein
MGESQMGKFGFSSWTLHMASIIIFGTLWGFAFREWKDARPAVRQGHGLDRRRPAGRGHGGHRLRQHAGAVKSDLPGESRGKREMVTPPSAPSAGAC